MTTIHMLEAAIAVLVLGYPVGFLIARRGLKLAIIAGRENAAAQLKEEFERTFMEGTRLVAEECAALKIQVENARENAGASEAKADRYFIKISDFERQSSAWQKLYYDQTLGHGNAQEMMMSTIEALAQQLQSMNVRPRIPSILHALRSEYLSAHEMPVKAAMAAIEAAKASATPAPPATETHPIEG